MTVSGACKVENIWGGVCCEVGVMNFCDVICLRREICNLKFFVIHGQEAIGVERLRSEISGNLNRKLLANASLPESRCGQTVVGRERGG
jgi:hypothetical protein